MECNKGEAIRAKSIAENKMLNKDFVGARKIVLKAQQMFPELENVCRMLTVCEVHCSSMVKVNGETDWYKILQVAPTADELTIKKQYRKLAFLLHPDKNKFGGAEAAFKLLGEAHRILTDQSKRTRHDRKRGANFRTVGVRQPAHQPNGTSFTKKQPGVASSFVNSTTFTQSKGFNQQPTIPSSTKQTFSTLCPFCGMRYEYYQNLMDRVLRCQSCKKPFIAHDLNAPATPSAAPWNHMGVPLQEKKVPATHYAGPKTNFGTGSDAGSKGNVGEGPTTSQPRLKSGFEFGGGPHNESKQNVKVDEQSGTANNGKFEKVKLPEVNKKKQAVKSSDGNRSQKRGRNVGEGPTTSQPRLKSGFEFGGGPHNESKQNVKVDEESGTANNGKFEKVKLPEVNKKKQAVKSSDGNRSQKRGRKWVVESSESEGSFSVSLSSDSDVVIGNGYTSGQNIGTAGSIPQRSARQKHDISYNEVKSAKDDEFATPKYKMSRTGNANDTIFWEEGAKGVNVQTSRTAAANMAKGLHGREQGRSDKGKGFNAGAYSNASADISSESSVEAGSVSYPDPEFCDFDKQRDENKFAVNQIWAIYDNLDAMPRYYALIMQVYGPKFKLWFTWLEYEPIGRAETLPFIADLPIGCGRFKLGKSEHTQKRLMFSHLMSWTRGAKKNTYDIFPAKGEVWPLFKNWDVGWGSYIDVDRQYEYEIVQVFSDLADGDVITVVRLVKIQGFVSLFAQAADKGLSPLKIQLKDVLRFSHKIPSYRLVGNEREGIPKGSLELDCASLPVNFFKVFPSVSLGNFKTGVVDSVNVCNGLNFKSLGNEKEVPTCTDNNGSSDMNGVPLEEFWRSQDISSNRQNGTHKHAAVDLQNNVEGEVKTQKQQVGMTDKAAQQSYEYPEPEFHNFEEERSTDKFEEGQIWAIYSYINKNPNYYGRISKIETERFKVHVTWLEGYPEQEGEKHWFNEQLPSGCGIFNVIQENCVLDTTYTFSHIVHACPTEKKTSYVIYPRVGEIWAVYKNWSMKWSLSNLEKCNFDLVEIIALNSSGFKVLPLKKVNRHRAVFMAEGTGVSAKILDVPFTERLKFSHRIPAARLTEERGGKLRGYWELDPASVPDMLLFMDST